MSHAFEMQMKEIAEVVAHATHATPEAVLVMLKGLEVALAEADEKNVKICHDILALFDKYSEKELLIRQNIEEIQNTLIKQKQSLLGRISQLSAVAPTFMLPFKIDASSFKLLDTTHRL